MAKIDDTGNTKRGYTSRGIKFPYSVKVSFPGHLEYIPAIRKFIAELLQVSNFNSKFAYRSEIIVDEICNNAVTYGCRNENSTIELSNTIFEDRIEFDIQDQGGTREDLKRLKRAINTKIEETPDTTRQGGLGLEIVRTLSERLDVVIDEKNLTSVHVVRKREDERDESEAST